MKWFLWSIFYKSNIFLRKWECLKTYLCFESGEDLGYFVFPE